MVAQAVTADDRRDGVPQVRVQTQGANRRVAGIPNVGVIARKLSFGLVPSTGCSYPLTAPTTMPCTKYRWKTTLP